MGLLNEKVAIITGSGGGIGREYALLFAKEGAKVVVNDIGTVSDPQGAQRNKADSVVDQIRINGGTAIANYDSVAMEEGVKNIIKSAKEHFGRLDILVNNAGILRDKTIFKMEAEDFDAVVAVHLRGAWLMTKEAGLFMKNQDQGGKIINTSSLAGLIGNFRQTNYGAAKAGIAGLTRVSALELQRYNIQVNAIAPLAYTKTTTNLKLLHEGIEKILSTEFIAPLALFLASSLSNGVTGKIFGIQSGKIFEYKITTTKGVDKGRKWTAQEIADEIDRIMKS